MGYLIFASMFLGVVLCQTNIPQTQKESCRNVNYHVSQLHQTNTYCNNGSGNGKVIEDIKIQLASLQAKVETLQKANNKTVTTCRPPYTARYKSSCYKFVLQPADWMKAYVNCRMDGAHLVALETIAENNHLRDYIKTAPFLAAIINFYTSGTDLVREGTWVWASTGQYIMVNNWGGKEPTHGREENCLGIHNNFDWKWFDLPCNSPREYICEKST